MAISRAQKKFAEDGVIFQINIDPVLEAIGAGMSLSDSIQNRQYIDAVVDEAFEKADETFNQWAAAYAATGFIGHMYEWGTVGINKGRTNMRLPPSSPNARLWTNFTEGSGLDRTIWYAFRPSVAFVPKPTKRETGMDTEIINKMRDHVFRWKAEVMEEGQEVTISPKKAKFLLIPAYEQNREYMRPHDVKRGYMLHKGPITNSPGGNEFAGTFATFWLNYWNTRGEAILNEATTAMIMADYQPEFIKPRTYATTRPVGTYNVKELVMAEKKKVDTRTIRRAKTRRLSK